MIVCMRTLTRPLSAAALLGAAVLALTACSTEPAHEYTVSGDAGLWLDDGYSAGVSETFDAAGRVCGVADGVFVDQVQAENGQVSVRAIDTATGDEVWTLDDALCGEAPGGQVAVASLGPDGSHIELADIATGDAAPLLDADGVVESLSVLGETEHGWIVQYATGSETRVGVHASPDRPAWSGAFPGQRQCTLLDGHVGCAGETSFTVLTAERGEVTAENAELGTLRITWLSDGYVLQDPTASEAPDPVGALYALDGNEVRLIEQTEDVPPAPAGALFTSADYMLDDAVAVTAAGSAVATVDRDGIEFHGDDAAEPGSAALAVSAGGQALAVDTGDAVVLLGADGDELAQLGPSGSEVHVVDGWLVVFDPASWTTTVFAPAG